MKQFQIKTENGSLIQECPIDRQKKCYRVGRAPSNEIVIEDSIIELVHAEIFFLEGEFLLKDCSGGRTMLNGSPITPGGPISFKPTDRISFGGTYLLHLEGEAAAKTQDRLLSELKIGDSVRRQETVFTDLLNSLRTRLKTIAKDHQTEINHSLGQFSEDLLQRVREMASVQELGLRLNEIHDFDTLSAVVIGLAVEISGAERGFLALLNEDTTRPESAPERPPTVTGEGDTPGSVQPRNVYGGVQSHRLSIRIPPGSGSGQGENPLSDAEVRAIQAIGEKAINRNEILVAGENEWTELMGADTPGQPAKSAIAAPLVIRGEAVGVLYLENRNVPHCFNDKNVDFIRAFAAQASVSLSNARLLSLVVNDHLTGLYNRRYFRRRLGEEVRRAARHHKPLSLVLIDIDKFSEVNKRMGRATGDVVLREIAGLIRETIRVSDVGARFGDEEYAVILTETGREGALTVAERLRERIEKQEIRSETKAISSVTCSVGVALLTTSEQGRDDLLRKAEEALVRSKKDGRNRVSIAG